MVRKLEVQSASGRRGSVTYFKFSRRTLPANGALKGCNPGELRKQHRNNEKKLFTSHLISEFLKLYSKHRRFCLWKSICLTTIQDLVKKL